MILAALIAAIWIAVSICAGLLFGRMATLNERSDPSRRRGPVDRPRAVPLLRVIRNRAA